MKKKGTVKKRADGTLTSYTPKLGKLICLEISTCTDKIDDIRSRNPNFPTRKCIWEWRIKFPDFAEMYNNAKRCQADLYIEETIDICDDASKDLITTKKGEQVLNSANVARAKLKIDTRKWLAAKLLPRIYGDSIFINDESSKKTKEDIKKMREIAKKCLQET